MYIETNKLVNKLVLTLQQRTLSKRGPSDGVGNEAFEMDPPKSPWRYPFRQTAFPEFNDDANGSTTRRDVTVETGPVKSHINVSRPPLRLAKYPFNRQISVDSQESGKSLCLFAIIFNSFLMNLAHRTPIDAPRLTNCSQIFWSHLCRTGILFGVKTHIF